MRRVLRMAGKVVVGFLWIVKGLLLILALGAAVLWPVSRGRQMGVTARRYTVGPASGKSYRFSAGCWDGRAVLSRGWLDVGGGPVLDGILGQVASGGQGWRLERRSDAYPWDEGFWPSRWGPLRWNFTDDNDERWTSHSRFIAAPLWGVSLAAGAWPLASITLLIRRRRKQRRLARVGCCQQCGYDLRATAAAGGPLLARCPECGTESPAPQRKED